MISQKRVCGYCRALAVGDRSQHCTLGYTLSHDGKPPGAKPLEPCPKPLTIPALIEAPKRSDL